METTRRRTGGAAGLLWTLAALVAAWGALVLCGVQVPGAAMLLGTASAGGSTLPGATAPEWAVPGGEDTGAHDATEVEMATAVLTSPDSGGNGTTSRWAGPTVTYRLHIDGYPAQYRQLVRDVMAYAARHTGLEVVETTGPAQIEVWPKANNGAHVSASIDGSGRIMSVRFELGCCRSRAAWEDGLQAFGPLGDHADSRSIFSNDQTMLRPGAFDAWALSTLYRLPPGASADQVRAALSAQR